MNIQRSTLACAAALAASMSAAYAGPCSPEIARTEDEINARLLARARGAVSAAQSTAATTHRQPTPNSIAAAEAKLGLISTEQVNAVKAAMIRARGADGAGDRSACEQALAEVRRVLDSDMQTDNERR